ncbi:alpha/beta-hydrolase [Aspergillus vadensis CBS 113365]|uniref:Alpha/beta-hydrolase n=1 Tax=Aspergillus vadensis (strain CBS 113365 / IMI 142717 / IBT 24658) TaxID=1448311 RepID=A0A319BG80_ASPVC|nr:alpha/beta-hydrolase [Aspergillus vadensis CBS 113365]PYH72186.1 alpha/beta-hydrolase [Aspergillus vadensis CBS 113365]
MSIPRPNYETIETDVDGYTRIKNIYIPMRDGIELCADVFLPLTASKNGEKVPVICSMGPYGKDNHASTFGLPQSPIYAEMYKHIKPLGPDACFELCDPSIWCKEYCYALLRVDSRGIGGSQGKLDPFGLERSVQIQADAEGQDLYDIVEWAAIQPWSSGKVAYSGISYYGMVGYWAAMQKPPHLSCVVSYESACDMYQASRRGGIYSDNFQSHWYRNLVIPYQGGKKEGHIGEAELSANRVDFPKLLAETEYPTDGVWELLKRARNLSDIEVPFYLAGNWTDAELHLPGNVRAFNALSSKYKWLEMHTGNHLSAFYEPAHLEMQRKITACLMFPALDFFKHHGTNTLYRENETSFPPTDAEYVPFYFTPEKVITPNRPTGQKTSFTYKGYSENLHFSLKNPFTESFELLGSPYLELEVSTTAKDMDIFIYLRAMNADGENIILHGNHGEPMDNFARGYFRLSHRDEVAKGFNEEKVISQPAVAKSEVVPGQFYSVLIPLYPAAFLFDQGQSLSIEIGSVDTASTIGPMRHEGGDRVKERFAGDNVIISHGKLVLPRVRR